MDGPHVMIVNARTMLASYPQCEHPDHSQAFVMWPNTPYAHLMVRGTEQAERVRDRVEPPAPRP